MVPTSVPLRPKDSSQIRKKDHQMPQEQKNMKMPKELCR